MKTFEVLVVDDDLDVTDIVQEQFSGREDIKLTVANSPEDAMRRVEEQFFHLAFIDMQLSANKPSGMGVFNRLRDARPTCQAVLLTRYPDKYKSSLFCFIRSGSSSGQRRNGQRHS